MSNSTKKSKRSINWWLIGGALLLLYPIVATMWNDYQLFRASQSYHEQVATIDPPTQREQYLSQAHAYNERLEQSGHHALFPEPGAPGFEDYMSTLDAPETNGVIARVIIPEIQVDLPVYHTTHPDVLYDGAGHMFGSDLPVGGEGNNAVISAHTGMINATMFDNLPFVSKGDVVIIEVMGQRLYYEVTGRKVVGPEDYEAVTYEPDKDKLTLITCTPYGINTDRLLVEAQRIDPPGEYKDIGWRPQLSWWMIAVFIIVVVGASLIGLVTWRRRKA